MRPAYLERFRAPVKQLHFFSVTYRSIVGRNILRAFGRPVGMRCDMLGVVGLSLKRHKFFIQRLWTLHDVYSLARFVQQCCAGLGTPGNMLQHVAIVWPNAHDMIRPTMLPHVVSKCCDRLAGLTNPLQIMLRHVSFRFCNRLAGP